MLITSRARLNVRGETVLSLATLSLPAADGWRTSEAVAMFVQRAQGFDRHFTINPDNIDPVTQICRLVDGLPLGIELATSMLPMLSCTELAQELTRSLAFLQAETRDLPADQRSLRAVFARSWQLLAPPEQTLLTKLAIFPATFHGVAAQTIAEATPPLLRRHHGTRASHGRSCSAARAWTSTGGRTAPPCAGPQCRHRAWSR